MFPVNLNVPDNEENGSAFGIGMRQVLHMVPTHCLNVSISVSTKMAGMLSDNRDKSALSSVRQWKTVTFPWNAESIGGTAY